MSSSTLHSTSDVLERVADAALPLLISFGADWCPPCRTLEPVLAEIAAEHPDHLIVEHVSVDDVPDLVRRFDIASAPTMLVFVNGEPQLRIVGARPRAALLEALSPVLG